MSSTPLRVYKFGGTSVGSHEAIRLAVSRVREAAPAVVVVVSAMNGVTDLLLGATAHALAGRTDEAADAARQFAERHRDIVNHLVVTRRTVDALNDAIARSSHELEAMCESIAILRELTARTRDAVVARGERLLAIIFAEVLSDGGIASAYVDATDVIVTEKRHGSLWPDFDGCQRNAASTITPLLENGRVVVLPGFIGRGTEGEVVTLGRGGSDFSAAIVARAVNADSLTLWKEVDGLMTADPRLVSDARVLPALHYREAAELAYYGAKVLHPRTMIPLADRGIPLFVRNSFNPSFSGTRIAADVDAGAYPVKALSAVHGQALLSIEGGGMMGVPGIAGRTFTALSRAGHSVTMISQASSEASICFVVDGEEADDAVSVLREEFASELAARLIEAVRADHSLALVAVVGLGMRGTRGIAARTFGALSEAGVNIVAIAQGSSELNITTAVTEDDAPRAIAALHREFQLERLRPLASRDRSDTSLSLLGFGQIGRALTRQMLAQETYFRHDAGIRLRTIAVGDRGGMLVSERGFEPDELLGFVQRKEAGLQFVESRGEKRDADVESLREQFRTLVFPLPSSRSILVDLTAAETAPLLIDALQRGSHVVVANKKPMAAPQEEFDAMIEAARRNSVALRYEATVGAGLPILDTLAKLKESGDPVESIVGCLSGTLGFLMTQLEDGIAWSDAVRQAHAHGYTEPDPRDDLSGIDVARKALILARSMGRRVEMSEIAVEALFTAELSDDDPQRFMEKLGAMDEAMKERVLAARQRGEVLRYVARIGAERITVGLEEVKENSPAGRLRGTDNQIVLQTKRYRDNPLVVTGPGAGAEVTAAGVLNDIVAIALR